MVKRNTFFFTIPVGFIFKVTKTLKIGGFLKNPGALKPNMVGLPTPLLLTVIINYLPTVFINHTRKF